MKSKIREVIYLATDLNQTMRELIQAIGELEIEIDNKLKQAQKRKDTIFKQEQLSKLYERLINDWDDLSYKEVGDIEENIKKLEIELFNKLKQEDA